jgi:hypothetical protein
LLPGDLLDWSGLLRWADAHFPGYDPDLDHGVYEEVGDAIDYLIKHGFLQRCNQENPGFIRTDKPPQVAYSVFGNGAVKYQLKRIAAVRQQRREDEIYIDALVRVLDGIETKTQQDESAPWE